MHNVYVYILLFGLLLHLRDDVKPITEMSQASIIWFHTKIKSQING